MLNMEDVQYYRLNTSEAIITMMGEKRTEEARTAFRVMMQNIDEMIEQIMEERELLGVEYKHRRDERWAVIMPETEPGAGGPVRLLRFNRQGLVGHSTMQSMKKAVEDLIREGYTDEDRGAMGRIDVAGAERDFNLRLRAQSDEMKAA